jgi:hypothetical protein
VDERGLIELIELMKIAKRRVSHGLWVGQQIRRGGIRRAAWSQPFGKRPRQR